MPSSTSRTLHVLGWVALVPMLALCATQWFGVDGRRTFVALQALTPFILLCAAPIALAACRGRQHALAIAALVPLVTLLALSFPIAFHADPPAVAENSPRLSIAYSNLLYYNSTPDAAAARMIASDADVLLLVEVTARLHDALVAALADGGTADYPYRIGTTGRGSESIELWSRHPIISGGLAEIGDRPAIDALLDVDGSEVRIVGVHPYPPTFNAPGWQAQLQAIGDAAATSDTPTVLIGDFNGSRWHPSFRRLLDRGWQDAHEVLGHGWSVSWPMDEGWLPPQFVRIDHALFRNGLTPTGIDDFEVPGSDHKGYRVDFGFTDRPEP
ncbi:MAG: endonuclease/exonuclease/phosphatase family protein [Actinomycetia bacterium]|nr:endonuclease/exonuclease/phosphatase family protein [Actinomycetes bacterium]